MTKVTFLLPESLKVFVDQQMAVKGYGSIGEYFRALLHDAQKREEEEERRRAREE